MRSGVRGGEAICETVCAHLVLLMRDDGQRGPWFGGAKQYEAGGAIGGKVRVGVGLIEVARRVASGDAASTGQTTTVSTNRGQDNSTLFCGIEYVLVGRDGDGFFRVVRQ